MNLRHVWRTLNIPAASRVTQSQTSLAGSQTLFVTPSLTFTTQSLNLNPSLTQSITQSSASRPRHDSTFNNCVNYNSYDTRGFSTLAATQASSSPSPALSSSPPTTTTTTENDTEMEENAALTSTHDKTVYFYKDTPLAYLVVPKIPPGKTGHYEITAAKRDRLGSRPSLYLRKKRNRVPGHIYDVDPKKKPLAISVDRTELDAMVRHFKEGYLRTRVVTLKFDDGTIEHVVVQNIHRHTVTSEPLNLELQRFKRRSKIPIRVPVKYINWEDSPAIKEFKCSFSVYIKALPIIWRGNKEIPLQIVVDLKSASWGTVVRASDVPLLPQISVRNHLDNPMLCSLRTLKIVEEEEEVPEAAAATTAPGATPAAGAAATPVAGGKSGGSKS